MKYLFLLLLLAQAVAARASQIVTGLRSKNFVAWDVWEGGPQRLKHQLLLCNGSGRELRLEVRLRRFRAAGSSGFAEAPAGKTFYRVRLMPQQLVQLPYPNPAAGPYDFLEYVENGRSVGLLELNRDPPPAELRQDGFRFYSNSGANAGRAEHWLALESLFGATPGRLLLGAGGNMANGRHCLARIRAGADTLPIRTPRLDSLRAADPSIVRLDSATRRVALPRPAAAPGPAPFSLLTLETECWENSYYYDERKNKHPEKTQAGGRSLFIPVFAQPLGQ